MGDPQTLCLVRGWRVVKQIKNKVENVTGPRMVQERKGRKEEKKYEKRDKRKERESSTQVGRETGNGEGAEKGTGP